MDNERKTEKQEGGRGWLTQTERDLHYVMHESGNGVRYAMRELRGLAKSREDALTSWVGPERAADVRSEFRPLHDDIGGLVNKALSGVQAGDTMILSKLEAGWKDLFGAQIAAVSRPLSVKGGHLVIEVRDSTFLYMFEHQKKEFFLEHLSAYTGGELKSIEFRPQGARRWRR